MNTPAPTPDQVEALARAWNDAGPNPEQHYVEKARLVKRWPTLANAIEAIVNPSPLKPALSVDARLSRWHLRSQTRQDDAA